MRTAKVCYEVEKVWKTLTYKGRKTIRDNAMRAGDGDFRLRCKIVLNLARGESSTTIHQVLGCSLSQVYRIAKRFVQAGEAGLADGREDNGEVKVDDAYRAELVRLVDEDSPQDHGYRRPTWTQELLLLVMEQRTGVRISQSRMCRLLQELNIRLGLPKPVVGCPWRKQRRKRRLRQLRQLADTLPKGEVLVYADEVDIHLNPKIGPDYMLQGTQKTVLTPGKNEKRYLAGALEIRTGRITWVEWNRKDSNLFILQLWQLVRDYPTAKCIHIVLDNFRIHKSKRTDLALAALGDRVKLHFLPPYCPDNNPIERVWRDLHDNVTRNHRCRTMKELMEEVYAYLSTRQQALKHQYATYTPQTRKTSRNQA